MNDKQIVDLYWARAENAISETANKYGNYCNSIAFHILRNAEDSEECVNDTYLKAWQAIPPNRPARLPVFLGKITRNLSLDRYKLRTREKRGGGQIELALDELEDCISAKSDPAQAVDDIVLVQVLNTFLFTLSKEARMIFMRRYWYLLSVKEIASGLSISESKVKMSLLRSREKLKARLDKEGIPL